MRILTDHILKGVGQSSPIKNPRLVMTCLQISGIQVMAQANLPLVKTVKLKWGVKFSPWSFSNRRRQKGGIKTGTEVSCWLLAHRSVSVSPMSGPERYLHQSFVVLLYLSNIDLN